MVVAAQILQLLKKNIFRLYPEANSGQFLTLEGRIQSKGLSHCIFSREITEDKYQSAWESIAIEGN